MIIGNNVSITHGCVLLSHDAAAGRINCNDNEEGIIKIEDNVFIGVNSVILRNVTIGKGSIIGAGSVVSRNIPSNVVAVGSPARIVKKLEII